MDYLSRSVLAAYTLALLTTSALAQDPKPQRTKSFKPFSIVSSKTNKVITSEYIESELMCKSTLKNLAFYVDLTKNYDVISTGGDYSLGITRLMGSQNGAAVSVDLMVTTSDHVLQHIAVNDEFILGCQYWSTSTN